MSIDQTPAHLSDVPGTVQQLRDIAVTHTFEEFTSKRVLCLASKKPFTNPGEAVQRVPEAERVRMGAVPRRQIIGPRSMLARGCDRIDQETLYRTASTERVAVERERIACRAARGHR